MFSRTIVSLACIASIASVTHAQVAQYTAPGGSFNPTTVAPHTSATPLGEVGSSGDLQPGVGLADTVFLQQNILSTDAAAAVANNQFYNFTLTPELGYRLNLSGLAFDATRGGASTPRGWVVRSSVDGFATNLGTADVPTQNPTLTNFSVPLNASFQNLASPVEFRVYGYAPSTGVGMFYDNITVNGTVLTQTLVRYEAPGGVFAPTVLGNHVLAGNLNENGSSGDLQPGVGLADTVFLQQNITSPTAADAVVNNQYFQFTVSAETGFELDLVSLTFDATRGGSSTPRGWVVRSSLDNFATDIAAADVPTQNPTLTSFNVDLTAIMFQDITSQVTFRIYGYAPTSGVGIFYDNIELHGAFEVAGSGIPEPASLGLMICGGVVLLRRARHSTHLSRN
jgi:hypothetical protein